MGENLINYDSLIIYNNTEWVALQSSIYYNEEDNMGTKLNKFIEENNIEVDENGNFTMCVVVDADNTEHELGTIFNNVNTEAYTLEEAYNDLEEDNNSSLFQFNYDTTYVAPFGNKKKEEKKTSIREKLLTIKDSIYIVTVNKKYILNVKTKCLNIGKYKVVSRVELKPELKCKIKEFNNSGNGIKVEVYNNFTLKSEIITLQTCGVPRKEDLICLVSDYLNENEKQVALMNEFDEIVL